MPMPYETTLPGFFAVGDVRQGSVKRVASAVGEGSVVVSQLHQYLAESRSAVDAAKVGSARVDTTRVDAARVDTARGAGA
jgi:uncharacterized NAD-dependent epimerase/dehydratase family protein